MCLVVVLDFGLLAKNPVVVDFAIDGESEGSFIVKDRLSTGIDTDNGETFMDEDGLVLYVVTACVEP